MNQSRGLIEKADLLGESLVGGATEAATLIMEELGKRFSVRFRQADSAEQFVIEVIVFYMHMIDLLAFRYLGPQDRQLFAERFIVAVIKEFLRSLSRDVSFAEFADQLKDTYNRRQLEYAQYKDLIPAKEEPLKGTLFWEFSKILLGFMDDANPMFSSSICLSNC